MPNQLLRIPTVYDTVTRRAMYSAIVHLKRITGLSEDVIISYPGLSGQMAQPGSGINERVKNTYSGTSKITVNVEEVYRETAVTGSPVRTPEEIPVFIDKKLGILLKPIYSYTDVRMSVVYRAKTKAEAEAWRNDIKVRIADNRGPQLITLDFHYPLPGPFIKVLKHLYDLRENVAGYGDTFGEYFNKHASSRVRELSSDAKDLPHYLAVIEKQVGVQARFDFTEPPREERSDAGVTWNIQFDWLLSYHQPVMFNFKYPVVVHNQIIDDVYFSEKPYDLAAEPIMRGMFEDAAWYTAEMGRRSDPIGGVRIPDYDEWIPKAVPGATLGAMNWLLTLDVQNVKELFDLNDMGDWVFHPAFIKFLRHEQHHLATRGKSLVYFTLFEDQVPVTDGQLFIDDTLVLSTNAPLSLRSQWHIRMSFITDYGLFDDRAIKAMCDNGRVTLLIFQSMMPSLDVQYAASNVLIQGQCLPLWYIQWFFGKLKTWLDGKTSGPAASERVDWPLVQYLTIVSRNVA